MDDQSRSAPAQPSDAQLELWARQHVELTRRYFLGLGVASLGALAFGGRSSQAAAPDDALAAAIAELKYLTGSEKFGTVERGNPLPYTHPEDKLREVGLVRETWKLQVLPDPESNSKLDHPLSAADGTALTFPQLLELGREHGVRFLKVMTCNNGSNPLGMGLWEGVPLRTVLWKTGMQENIRRVYYHGYHNDKPEQLFQGSLPIGRVLEDPPGDHPVILCYKLNGELLSGKRGGPVRMLVPDAYGFKSVKWLTHVYLTNNHQANDTYAKGNNDNDSWMKTFARFVNTPGNLQAGQSAPLTGLAQVGISGLSKVQYWIAPREEPWPDDDPTFTRAPWKDVELLPPPKDFGPGFAAGEESPPLRDFDPATGRPKQWPLRYTLAHWATVIQVDQPGKYDLRCRSIDANGVAQPLPRPFKKSGRNVIQSVPLIVNG